MLGHGLAVDEVGAGTASAIDQGADVVQGEGVVMVERRDVAAPRVIERVVDGVRAGRLPEGVRVIGVARTLGQLEVADARIGMRLDGRSRVRLRAIAAHEHLDVGP
jgi:hypothetical protein